MTEEETKYFYRNIYMKICNQGCQKYGSKIRQKVSLQGDDDQGNFNATLIFIFINANTRFQCEKELFFIIYPKSYFYIESY